MNFQSQLAKAIELKKAGLHQQASYLLDELASAILYQSSYNKENIDVALYCVKAIKRRRGPEIAAFAAMKIREDREQKITCFLSDALFFSLVDDKNDDNEKATSATSATLVNLIKSNKKLLKALAKNASAQYVNRLLAKDPALCHLQAKGQKLKNFFKSNSSLFE